MKNAAQPKAPGLRQTMAGLHTWTGLLVGWLLYAMFLTGTVSYFRSELSQWMRPEVRPQERTAMPLLAERMVAELSRTAAGSNLWVIYPPDARSHVVSAHWTAPTSADARPQRRSQQGLFDPATGQPLQVRATQGGDFFYNFHYQFHYLPAQWGRWLAGVCAMFMLVAIISGVITHKKIFVDFFTFRWGKGQRSWLDAHNVLSVFGLPFHLMITFSGLVTLMAMYIPWGEQAAIRTPHARLAMANELHAYMRPGPRSGDSAPLAPIARMVKMAEERWGAGNINRIMISHPGDANARISLSRGDERRVSVSPQFLLFDGASGALLQAQDSVGPAAHTRGVLYALHLGRFSDLSLRWLYFVVSLAGTAMVGTGLVMWTVKRRQRLRAQQGASMGLVLTERLNVAAIAGLSIAMAAFLAANRLLPVSLPARAGAEIQVFFLVWCLAAAHACLRPARQAWREQLWLATALLCALPLLNAFTTQRPLWHSLAHGDTVFAAMDLMCCALAALHATLAWRVQRPAPPLRRN